MPGCLVDVSALVLSCRTGVQAPRVWKSKGAGILSMASIILCLLMPEKSTGHWGDSNRKSEQTSDPWLRVQSTMSCAAASNRTRSTPWVLLRASIGGLGSLLEGVWLLPKEMERALASRDSCPWRDRFPPHGGGSAFFYPWKVVSRISCFICLMQLNNSGLI